MGVTKSDKFSKKENETADIFKAFGHPARIAIINHLLKVNACICTDIVNELPLAQPTVSQHLKELKNSGIIKGSIEGNSICYCLNENSIIKLKTYLDYLVTEISNNKSTCC